VNAKWAVRIRRAFSAKRSCYVIAGLLVKNYGPVFGGLFLVFPAIFPVSASLVQKHERQKKQRAEIAETARGQQAAGLEAAGSVVGGVGAGHLCSSFGSC
jgi:hypothetical protein